MSDTHTIEELEARLAVQEGRLKTTRVALAVLFVLCLVAVAGVRARLTDDASALSEVRARRFVLIDDEDGVAGRWEATASGSRIDLANRRPGPNGTVREPGIHLESGTSSGPRVVVHGNGGLLLYHEVGGSPELRVSSGEAELTLACLRGSPYLGMLDGNGGQADFWPASLHVTGTTLQGFTPGAPRDAGLHVWSGTPSRQLHLGADSAGRPILHTVDADGTEVAGYRLEVAR